MMRKRHLSDDQIIEFLHDPAPADVTEERAANLSHFNGCTRCADRFNEYAQYVAALSRAAVWDKRAIPDITDAETLHRVAILVRQLHEEGAGVDNVLDKTLTGPPATWKARLALLGNIHTYSMVQALVARSETTFATNPVGATITASIAVEIADALRIDAYPFDFVINARAHAWFEHSFLLSYRGHFPEALAAIDKSEALFRQMPITEFQLARVKLVRASIYRSTDRISEAITLAGEAAATFATYGDDDRLIKARMTQAAMLMQVGRVAEALTVCQSIEQNATFQQSAEYGFLLHNVAICHRGMGRYDEAEDYLSRASSELQKHSMTAERIRTEWSRAVTMVARGRFHDAIPLFRQAWTAFAKIGLDTDAALTALELAEVLLANNQPEEVPIICRKLLDHFNRNNMMSRAVTALAFLREAVAMGKATPVHIRHVADFIRELAKQPALTYTPPPL
jgi:tetratricopeptide (TPR) repeat protein